MTGNNRRTPVRWAPRHNLTPTTTITNTNTNITLEKDKASGGGGKSLIWEGRELTGVCCVTNIIVL